MARSDYAVRCAEQNERILKTIVNTQYPKNPNFKNHVGEKIGRLTITRYVGENAKGTKFYECKCDCGNIKIIRWTSLVTGNTTSCGCYHQETMEKLLTTHGLSFDENHNRPRLYSIYYDMKTRCYNKNTSHYHIYGGKGIKICDEWLNPKTGFKSFYDWAISNGYRDDLTIDRIDSNGNYCPENCRWATYEEQANNIEKNIYITSGYCTFTMSIWAKILKVNNHRIRNLLLKLFNDSYGDINNYVVDDLPSYFGKSQKELFVIDEKYLKFNKYDKFNIPPSQYLPNR